ncbi:MAG TPA: MupA/Atu3671 family FMN-dependent luciferase-like monooxygenase, partial [Chthoniobacterales bacterium]
MYVREDVSTVEGAVRAVHRIKAEHGALHGILHAAGTLRDGLIWGKSQADFTAVAAPKVLGVEALDAATAEDELDCFILFSSTAGLTGNVGQSDYAYSNGYLDAFAHRREQLRRAGRRFGRTVSINWPLWRDGGMRDNAAERAATSAGLASLEPADGLRIFDQVLSSGETQVCGGMGDEAVFRKRFVEVAGAARRAVTEPRPIAAPAGHVNRKAVTDYLIRQFAELTRLPIAQIHPDEPIDGYGVDSIMVTTFAQMLEHDLGEISKTLLFEYGTLESLGTYLLETKADRLEALFQTNDPAADSSFSHELPSEAPDNRFMPAPEAETARYLNNEDDNPGVADGIAIIGVFGRFPQADNLDEFWANLVAGRDCIEEVPSSRWDYRKYYDPETGKPGRTSNKWGGFIRDIDKFDPLFFNISPREATFMDPQERIFLETVWKTVEDAGYSRTALSDRKVGVYVGVMYGQYQLYGVEERLNGNPVSLSSSFATIANRVSYTFNWHGPSLAVDTMCSGSLTSVHLACSALNLGECELAIAGGVNATLHPEKDLILSQTGFSTTDGRCRAFGEGGEGYVPGEGVGALLLKPLARAEADRDHIYGVITASGLNHGGRTNGYTVPNSKSQAEVVLDVFRRAAIDPATINCIEAHGTGTALGDPIEIAGLQQAFEQRSNELDAGADRPRNQFCAISSVKSNIGHCESAAGIAGIIKVLLQLKYRKLVPSLHVERLNPNINLVGTYFRVQQQLQDWEPVRIGQKVFPRRAGVSSFGAGGANAHLVIEEREEPADLSASAQPAVFVLSARRPDRLRELAKSHIAFLERCASPRSNGHQVIAQREPSFLRRVAYTLQVGREPLEERIAFVTDSIADCAAKLQGWLGGNENGLFAGNARKRSINGEGSARAVIEPLCSAEKLARMAEAWVHGATLPWHDLYPDGLPRRIPLPTYPFARNRFWVRPDDLPEAAPAVVTGSEAQRPGNPPNRQVAVKAICSRRDLKPERGSAMDGRVAGDSGLDFSLMFFSDNSQVSVADKYELVVAAAEFADQHGFQAVWTPERHFHPFGGVYSSPATLTAALAMRTKRVRLRAGSVIVPLEDPIRLVEAWAVVDNLSNGRVDLALASGWHPNDFALAPEAYTRLREVWLERIPLIQSMWRGEPVLRVNGKGETVSLRLFPEPRQPELPLWLTASRRVETFVEAGRRGLNVLTMLQGSTIAQLGEKIRRYREARQEAGFDDRSGKVTLMLHTFVDGNGDHARRIVRQPLLDYIRSSLDAHKGALNGAHQLSTEDLEKTAEFSYERYCREASLVGDPFECLEMVRKCQACGVDEIACLLDFGVDPASVLASLPHLQTLRDLSRQLPPMGKTHEFQRPVIGAPRNRLPAPEADDHPGWHLTPVWKDAPVDPQEPEVAGSAWYFYSGEA